jgi:NAD(P)-dependent dehydrogenase (short-subunit alcohol dehydrogenase family)
VVDSVVDTAPGTGGDTADGALVVVVTGASRGIGAGLAAHFASRGIRLGLGGRSAPPTPTGSDAVTAVCDVTDAAAVDRLADEVVARFGRIDAWVNNAGLLEPIGSLADADPAALERLVATNVSGVIHGSATFARHVRRRPGGGSLVNLSSGAATNAYRGWAAYCASKAAVEMLTEVVGLEERDHGLVAYAVAPGVVDTDMQALIRATPEASFPGVERFHRIHDDGALLTPGWVASCILERCVDPATRVLPAPGDGAVRFRVPDPPGRGG